MGFSGIYIHVYMTPHKKHVRSHININVYTFEAVFSQSSEEDPQGLKGSTLVLIKNQCDTLSRLYLLRE